MQASRNLKIIKIARNKMFKTVNITEKNKKYLNNQDP